MISLYFLTIANSNKNSQIIFSHIRLNFYRPSMSGRLIGRTLVVTFPGSLKALKEYFEILVDALPKAVSMIEKQGRKGRIL